MLLHFTSLCMLLLSTYGYAEKFKINLDLPPEKRWVDVCLKNEAPFRSFVSFAKGVIIPKPLETLANDIVKHIDKYIPPDLFGEMKGMADTLNIDIGLFAVFNIMYDVTAFSRELQMGQYSGCTSIVAQDLKGTIWHARNLDYGQTDLLRNMTIDVEFTRNGEVVFTTTTYAGLVGLFTGQKPKQFTLSIDERNQGSVDENSDVLLSKNYTFTSVLARQVLENASGYDEAVSQISKALTPAPAYFIMGGVKPGEGAIITRDRFQARAVYRLNAANGTWFLVETNYDLWTAPPASDPRRNVAIKAMKALGQNNINSDELFKVLSIHPVFNNGTTYTTIMSASQPDIYKGTVRYYT